MDEVRPPGPSSTLAVAELEQPTRGAVRRDDRASTFLDEQLNQIFGPTFAPVIEHEFRKELGLSLFDALRLDSAKAFSVLDRIFQGERPVVIILSILMERLRALDSREESRGLVSTIRPILQQEASDDSASTGPS